MACKFVLSSKPLTFPWMYGKWMIEDLFVFIFSFYFHLWCLHLSHKERNIYPHGLPKALSILLILFLPYRTGSKIPVKADTQDSESFQKRAHIFAKLTLAFLSCFQHILVVQLMQVSCFQHFIFSLATKSETQPCFAYFLLYSAI